MLAHVAPSQHLPGVSAAPATKRELRRIAIDEGEELLAALAHEVCVSSSVETRVAFGTPGGTLADLAEEEGAGLVVVGSRGRGVFKAALLGSVSTELIGASRRPVVVVPPGIRSLAAGELAGAPRSDGLS